jgi:uncharacterized phage-associated protein
MATPLDVAAFIINEQHDAGRTVDKMQLQKWLYLAQGAHIAWFGDKAFNGEFRAYRKGPVERGVEQTYAKVVADRTPIPRAVGGHPDRLPQSVRDAVGAVLEEFGEWDGTRLESFTKFDGSPWKVTRGDLPPSAASGRTIPTELLTEWFKRRGVFPAKPLSQDEADLFRRAAAGDAAALAELL